MMVDFSLKHTNDHFQCGIQISPINNKISVLIVDYKNKNKLEKLYKTTQG